MNILSIETSCDETAISIVQAKGDFPHATYTVLGNSLFSQVDIHREYGGVFPSVAKREHAKKLVPMLERTLEEAGFLEPAINRPTEAQKKTLRDMLHREQDLFENLITFLEKHERPNIDLIAVTHGPGLEPALWVGINFARALAHMWNIPVAPTNHMEGHVLSSIFDGKTIPEIAFPALALLISGGHTELLLLKNWNTYTLAGQTRDDAVGEAFDKVARMLDLPYPGGPEISRLAEKARERDLPEYTPLPRPMLDSDNFDFSFSGLKTAVKYAIAEKELSADEKKALARDFEETVTEVLLKKTARAIYENEIETLIVGGGVSANNYIRTVFFNYFQKEFPTLTLYLPSPSLSTDNSIMIALAGHARAEKALHESKEIDAIRADGNLSLSVQPAR